MSRTSRGLASRRGRPGAGLPVLALTLALLGGGAGLPAAAQTQTQDQDPVEARAFRVYYRSLADAADVVGPLLSEEGSLTMRTRLDVLLVEDRASVLRRVAALLESFDLPPRSVEVTLTLFLGMDRREERAPEASGANSFTQEVRGILETLGDFTKWQDYEPLGSRAVTGVEGGSVTADLTEDYRVMLIVDAVDPARGMVRFERVVLQRLRRDEEGLERTEDLYSMGMVMELERLRVIGAASGPDSKRALFLTLQVRER